MKKIISSLLIVFATFTMSFGQEKNVEGYTGLDVLTKFVWRGIDMHTGPSVQPILGVATESGLDIGVVGAFSLNGQNYQEVDLYAMYTYKFITIGLVDYFVGNNNEWDDPVLGEYNPSFLDFDNETTAHILEANISLGTEDFPLILDIAYNFWGLDKDNSAYTQLNYSFSDNILFVGASFDSGLYKTQEGFGIVNLGISHNTDISVSEKIKIPVKTSLIINPSSEKIYLTFGFSF